MQNWIKLLYKNIYSNVELNGALTKPVEIKRGIRQDCPISMILFITAADALTRHIEKEKKILGFKYQKFELKILQYADDTTFFFQNLESPNIILKELKKYERVSGQKISQTKSQILINDPMLKTNIKQFHPVFNLTENVELLGINFDLHKVNSKNNWHKAIQRIKSNTKIHEDRKLSIRGKIQIINTLLVPQIIHLAKILIPPQNVVNQINSLMYRFLWHPNWIENIKRTKLTANTEQGGINMINIKAKFDTCRVEKIQELAKVEEPLELWQKWAIYNLSFRLKHINQKLYFNLHPHAITPNKTWDDIFKIFLKIQ